MAKKRESVIKDLLGGTIKEMLESEMDDHLGYESYERSDNQNSRNGHKRSESAVDMARLPLMCLKIKIAHLNQRW